MAEHLFRRKLALNNIDESQVIVKSGSLTTMYEPENSPASWQGVEVMETVYQIDMKNHRSKLLTAEDVEKADLIVPVKRGLKDDIVYLFPDAEKKLLYFPQDIDDPWRQPVDVFKACAEKMDKQLDTVYQVLQKIL
jgi:protein-tyrosine-phosphatase